SNLSQSDSTSASKKSSDSDSDKGNSGSPKFSDISSSSNANGYITDLRYWTTPDYTRVVINVSDERRYVYQLLDENPSTHQPKRLYLDIKKSLLGQNLHSHTRINDDLLLQARAAQYKDDTVRVVVDIKSFDSYKVFSMRDPFRIIVDVWGDKSEKNGKTTDTKTAQTQIDNKSAQTQTDTKSAQTQDVSDENDSDDVDIALKLSTKKSTKTSKTSSEADEAVSDISSDAEKPASEDEIASKASTKTATKSSSTSLVEDSFLPAKSSKVEPTSEEPPEIASETNAKGTSHLPVKKSLKASTMVLSDATRKMLRKSLMKESQDTYAQTVKTESKSSKKDVKISKIEEESETDQKEPPSRKAAKGTTRVVQIAPGSNVDRIKASSIAKQLALGVRTIVIDPGHGGRDPGASGHISGIYEKNVVLSISKKLAKKIESRLNCNVIMTRSRDTYLSLEERTAIANTKNADLFISLHCNASNDPNLVGIETYYLNLATDERAINVAARENATSRKNISDLESILNDLMKNAKINESSRLSSVVQKSLYNGMKSQYSKVRNLGVKQAPFYVLLGASMPSILIETSFISNPEECRRLTDSAYQNALCDAITDGIAKYIRETNPQRL
ncbi:MAG: N-acetylmuramoyl-L-alanine amidase, partial [Desulfamplus sp.]